MRAIVRGTGSFGGPRPRLDFSQPGGERRGQRTPDGGRALAQLLELVATEPQHQTIAGGRYGGGAGAAGQERDFTDRRARPDLGDGAGAAFDTNLETAGDDHEQGIGRLALANQHFAAFQRQPFETSLEPAALIRIEIPENADAREALVG